MYFKNDDQLRSYLKSESKRLGISIANTYNTFFSLLLLKRICERQKEELVVKGSFSELAHLGQMIRPVTDIDLVSRQYHNNPLLILYQAMYDEEQDLLFELKSIPKKSNTGMYKLSLETVFGKMKHPLSIDFMELSNTLYDIEMKKVNSPFKDMPSFYVNTPTYEEHMAEKLCIVAESNQPNKLNTRVKDFYDIFNLYYGQYDYEKLCDYFAKMIVDRDKISIESLSVDHLNQDFLYDHFPLWLDMSAKYEFLNKKISFKESVELTRNILDDQITRVRKKS